MSTVQTYLYDQIQEVYIDSGSSFNRTYTMLFTKDLKVYKGVANTLTFLVKNREQKSVNLTSCGLTFNLVNSSGEALMIRPLTIVDNHNGRAELLLTDGDLLDIDDGSYTYSLIYNGPEQTQLPVFNDENWGVGATLEIISGSYPTFSPSTTAVVGEYTSGVGYTQGVNVANKVSRRAGMTTAAYYLDNFTGTITAQATMDSIVDLSDAEYIDLGVVTYNDESGVKYGNFSGMFYAIRFKVVKTSGEVDYILVR
jgi:hypothetical protein